MTDTGEIIKACREHRGMSVNDLAEIADVSYQTIFAIERKKDCRVSTFEKLLEGMGYEIEIMRKETERCE